MWRAAWRAIEYVIECNSPADATEWRALGETFRSIVLQLDEVAEIEAQMFSFAQKFNRRTVVEFSTKPAILPN